MGHLSWVICHYLPNLSPRTPRLCGEAFGLRLGCTVRDGLSIWIQLLPVAVVTAWIVAERTRLRRLRSFGDPAILGMPGGKRARILALALLTGSFGSLAAILPFAVPKAALPDGESLVEILLDSRIAEGGDSQVAYVLEYVEEKVR